MVEEEEEELSAKCYKPSLKPLLHLWPKKLVRLYMVNISNLCNHENIATGAPVPMVKHTSSVRQNCNFRSGIQFYITGPNLKHFI
jgi:hypothetical protein